MEGQAGGKLDIPALPDFDSNIITPGTEFMARLATEMRRFFAIKLVNDEGWRHLSVGGQGHVQGWGVEHTRLVLSIKSVAGQAWEEAAQGLCCRHQICNPCHSLHGRSIACQQA